MLALAASTAVLVRAGVTDPTALIDDESQLREIARRVALPGRAADMVAATHREAKVLVDRYWGEIGRLAYVLERMGDRLDRGEINYFLRHLKPTAKSAPPSRTRSVPQARALPRREGDDVSFFSQM
jgi:hypothetical protein